LRLESIDLQNFRSYDWLSLEFSPAVNIILGENGAGKTNILEAVSCLCLSRSFRSAGNFDMLKKGKESFSICGSLRNDSEIESNVRIEFDETRKTKNVEVNREKLQKITSLVGLFPIVFLSPAQSSITFGSPGDRRQFVDIILSQTSRVYLEALMDYKKVLKHRNKILAQGLKDIMHIRSLVSPWNERMIELGSKIMNRRMEFTNRFSAYFSKCYEKLSGPNEVPGMQYKSSFDFLQPEQIESMYRNKLEEEFKREIEIGCSLVGPHRDDFLFTLNGFNLCSYASQGQHKTFLIALKLAEFEYLKETCNETPILVFDDVLSELDSIRARKLLETTGSKAQVFVTSTDEHLIDKSSASLGNVTKIFIKESRVEKIEQAV